MADIAVLNTGKKSGSSKTRLCDFSCKKDGTWHSYFECLFLVNEIYFAHAVLLKGRKKGPRMMQEVGLLYKN